LAPDELLRGLRQALERGVRLVQLRAPAMFDPQYRDLAADAQGLCAGRAQLMLKGPLEWLGDFPAAGWHLTAEQLRRYAPNGRPFPRGRWLAASCHSAEELALAAQMGVDFVTLSPVLPTHSHPEAEPLGWEQTSTLIEHCTCPVFVLGGLSGQHLTQARDIGAQGIAGIRGFWPLAWFLYPAQRMPGAAKLIAMSRRRAPRPDSLDRWTRNEPTEIQARSPGAGKHRPGGNLRVCLAGAPGAPACRVRPAADPGRTSAGPAGP